MGSSLTPGETPDRLKVGRIKHVFTFCRLFFMQIYIVFRHRKNQSPLFFGAYSTVELAKEYIKHLESLDEEMKGEYFFQISRLDSVSFREENHGR